MRKTLLTLLLCSVCASAYAQSTDRPLIDQSGQRKTIPSGDALLPNGLAQGAPAFSSTIGAIYSRNDISQAWRYWGLNQVSYIQSAFGAGSFSATFSTTPVAGHYFVAVCSSYLAAPSVSAGWTSQGSIAGANLNGGAYGSPYMLVVEELVAPGASSTQTPCTGTGPAVTITEVTADPVKFTNSLDSVTFGTQPYRSTSSVSKLTGANNELGIVIGSSADDSPGNVGTPSFSAGWSNTTGGNNGTIGNAVAQQAFPTSGTTASATITGNGGPGDWGLSSVLILLKPGLVTNFGWQPMGDLWQVLNSGSPITPSFLTPRTLNFSTGLLATDDGNGNETITDPNKVGINGTPTSGDCTSWFNTTTIQDLGGVCPKISGTPTAGDCVKWLNATTITDAAIPCGGGGGGSIDNFARAVIIKEGYGGI